MLFFFPYGVDNPMRRLPLMNWALMAASVGGFVLQQSAGTTFFYYRGHPVVVDWVAYQYGLRPASLRWYQFITSGFLHGGFWHLFFNMVALWVFGNNVNDRLGHVRYLLLYLGCELASNLGYVLLHLASDAPCIGASGAIFGMMGLYLAFFPVNDVNVFYLFIVRPGTFRCSCFWIIGLYVAFNVLDTVMGTAGNVAVVSHLSGFAVGFGAGLLLLKKGWVERDEYDFVSWLEGRREKRLAERFARPDPLDDSVWAAPTSPPDQGAAAPLPFEPAESAQELATAIRNHLSAAHTAAAFDAYERLLRAYPNRALDRATQVSVANALLKAHRYDSAADAYVRLAHTYPEHPHTGYALYPAAAVHLARLGRPDTGHRLLQEALPRLTDPTKIARARQALARVASPPGAKKGEGRAD
ncbi:MAG: rhomboid family intramembrane serine protease [Candidatus Brocadiae bacterium]|nr:rhomboid family intramembrane serine protease [Candidatus Brocadiia bacterium]